MYWIRGFEFLDCDNQKDSPWHHGHHNYNCTGSIWYQPYWHKTKKLHGPHYHICNRLKPHPRKRIKISWHDTLSYLFLHDIVMNALNETFFNFFLNAINEQDNNISSPLIGYSFCKSLNWCMHCPISSQVLYIMEANFLWTWSEQKTSPKWNVNMLASSV